MIEDEDCGSGSGGGGCGGSGGGSSGGSNGWARACDTCRAAACAVYCRADSAYLCTNCDLRIHAANQVASRHERVWICEACERAPAAFLCKADAASLCATCDADIHAANPLARRHHRVPILPIAGTMYGPPATDPGGSLVRATAAVADEAIDEEDEDEAASWLLINPVAKSTNHDHNHNQNNNGFLVGGEVDEYLDLVEYNSCAENQFSEHFNHQNQQQNYSVGEKSYGGDSVVPVQCVETKEILHHQQQQQQHQHQNFQMGIDYESPRTGYSYSASMSHSVSVSSMEGGVVPESTMSDISVSHPRPPKGTIDLFSSPPIQIPTQLSPMDREARVLRYREKKKNRKFEKTIRYASRKAYAETRPRIKGRFAKRTEAEVEVDQMFSTTMMRDGGYGIVPSF